MMDVKSFDYGKFMKFFVSRFPEDVGMVLKPDYNMANTPDYPFVTYSFINPYIDVGKSSEHQPYFDIALTFVVHSNEMLQAMTKSGMLLAWFKDGQVQEDLLEQGIRIMQLYDVVQLTNVYATESERRDKFDVRLRVKNVDKRETDEITEVTVNSKLTAKKE